MIPIPNLHPIIRSKPSKPGVLADAKHSGIGGNASRKRNAKGYVCIWSK